MFHYLKCFIIFSCFTINTGLENSANDRTYLNASGNRVDCNCNALGVDSIEGELDLTCDPITGQCHCICDVEGYSCDTCTDYHYGFPECHGNS